MAKVVKNEKGFKVIEVSLTECVQWGGLGSAIVAVMRHSKGIM